MELIIEIGSPEQRSLIETELAVVPEVINLVDGLDTLKRIVIPEDFAASVNNLQGTTNYVSTRGMGESRITALGKIVPGNDGVSIVLSPELYTSLYDSVVRYFVVFHEMSHVRNRYSFPELPTAPYSVVTYLTNLYQMYDEYSADRTAYKIVDILKELLSLESELWEGFKTNDLNGFLNHLKDAAYYNHIRSEIAKFRHSADVTGFLQGIQGAFDTLCLTTVHLFALLHHEPACAAQADLSGSRFINPSTIAMMDFFKQRFDASTNELRDGIPLVTEYLKTFGFLLEDNIEGSSYCHVLDI